MNILIAGASGCVGHSLVEHLGRVHHLILLGRDKKLLERTFPASTWRIIDWTELDSLDMATVDVVMNVCGATIAKPWNDAYKKELLRSRLEPTDMLVRKLLESKREDIWMINASAVGIYPNFQVDNPEQQQNWTETDAFFPENNFAAQLVERWEASLLPLQKAGIKTTRLRFGVVLDAKFGMLKELYFPTSLGFGCILGDGQQPLPWIHHHDLGMAVRHILQQSHPKPVYNLCAPHIISQSTFIKAFADTLRRPLFLRLPRFVVKILFGEMGEAILLSGPKVQPKALEEEGFRFTFKDIRIALLDCYKPKTS